MYLFVLQIEVRNVGLNQKITKIKQVRTYNLMIYKNRNIVTIVFQENGIFSGIYYP